MAAALSVAGLLNLETSSRWTCTKQQYTRRILASFKQEERIGERVWREYGKAVRKKDLKRALGILESVQIMEKWREQPSFLDLGQQQEEAEEEEEEDIIIPSPPQDLRNVLDTCISATDMTLVARTYEFLQNRGLLPGFGKCKNITAESSRDVTPAAFLEATGLDASKLSPKKWGLAGTPSLLLVGSIVVFNILVNNGIDIRPFLASILAFGVLDAVYLGGTGLAAILVSWPPYKRRVFTHEAGHVLVAYLLGCPIRGVILDPVQAMRLGVQGQAGTQFWDATLEDELRQGRLTNASFDRYSMVLFAGIAAEALVYGEAEGGENDENLFKAIVSVLSPPWSPSQMSNQARWAVLQSYKLLRDHRKALDTVVRAFYEGEDFGNVVTDLEFVLSSENATIA
ncbi:hypothetical protein GOP47_0015257 [Adiantum capillus-veneris]|uniref:Uncharacterized protein n=1 Tax=Adiantum capillus-veneris TaxID=13818 RepID=A0A9D4UKA5_ADICA|nr:hypothetical protein GOP47_0015257 [Adiantum capillus-veneris]